MSSSTGTASASVTLIDFGFARSPLLDESVRDNLVGTVRYLAPEAAGLLAAPADERSDLYAVGVLLFECLAGAPPFPGPGVADLLRQHLTMPVPDVCDLRTGVPRVSGRDPAAPPAQGPGRPLPVGIGARLRPGVAVEGPGGRRRRSADDDRPGRPAAQPHRPGVRGPRRGARGAGVAWSPRPWPAAVVSCCSTPSPAAARADCSPRSRRRRVARASPCCTARASRTPRSSRSRCSKESFATWSPARTPPRCASRSWTGSGTAGPPSPGCCPRCSRWSSSPRTPGPRPSVSGAHSLRCDT